MAKNRSGKKQPKEEDKLKKLEEKFQQEVNKDKFDRKKDRK